MRRSDLTQELVREWFDYDPETGVLSWKKKPSKLTAVGDRAGTLARFSHDLEARWRVKFRGRPYYAYNIIWLWVYGEYPKGTVDHLDRDSSNDRLSNLRDRTRQQQNLNRRLLKSNVSGYQGVSPAGSKWRAKMKTGGKSKHLAYCDAAEDAAQIYNFAAYDVWGDDAPQNTCAFNRGRRHAG